MKTKSLTAFILFLSAAIGSPAGIQVVPPLDPAVTQVAMTSLFPCPGANSPEALPCQQTVLTDINRTHEIPMPAGEWSPDGTRLLVSDSEIYVMTATGVRIATLTSDTASDPAWSRDGTRIAFASYRDGPLDLYVMNADGSGVVRVGTGVGMASQPTWSPDGTRLAFTCIVDPVSSPWWSAPVNQDICALNADGSGFARLTSEPGVDSEPDWSPDGSRILFASDRYGTEIVVMNPDGSDVTRVSPGVPGASPRWSPDGTRIAFVYLLPIDWDQMWMPWSFVFVMNADGTDPIDLGWGNGPISWRPSPGGPNNRPVASFTFDCTETTCNLDGSPSSDSDGTIASYGWQFDDGTKAWGATVTHTFAGSHNVRLTVMDDDGALATLAQSVNQLPVVSFTTTCTGLTCTFDGSASIDPDGYLYYFHWGFGDGTDRSGYVKTVTHTYAAPGSYNVRLTAWDSESVTASSSQTITVANVNVQPVASFASACSGATCSFNAAGSSDPDGTIASYAWNFGDGQSALGPTATHTYATGTFSVSLHLVDNAGGTATTQQTVSVVNAPPVASFTRTCSGLTCIFNGSGSSDPDGTITNYSWSFGDGTSIGGAPMVSHSYTSAGTYSVTLTVTSNNYATGSQSHTVSVALINALPTALFTSACGGLACSFNATASRDPDGTIVSYAWNFGDGTTGSGATVSRTYAVGGAYTVTLNVTDNRGATSTQVQGVTVVSPEVHVGDLDRARTVQSTTWTATVTIKVHDKTHGLVANAVVSGAWTGGTTSTCTTNGSGQCAVSKSGIAKKTNSVSLTVTNVTRAGFVYKPPANHDPDGDSNGTTVTVNK